MVSSSRSPIPLFLPLAAVAIGAAVIWGGLVLAKQERTERVPRTDAAVDTFASELQEKVTSLEARYERHLSRICRTDLNHFFGVQDAIDGVVGVRQLSTLNPEGKIDFHLPASDVKTVPELPVPVIDRRERPPGRERFAEVGGADLFGGGEGESGWIETPQGLFFFQRVSVRRVVLLLVDPRLVEETMATTLAPWIGEALPSSPGAGADRVLLRDRVLASVGVPDKSPTDTVRSLATRFGPWLVQSWDERRTVVTWRRGFLAGSIALAVLILLVGAVTTISIRRAFRLAEQRVSFVNRVSHELKTPLTNILLNADLAVDGADVRGRQRLARVQEETRRLARLIDNVLAFSRRGSKPAPSSGPADLRPLVEEVVETFSPSLERCGVKVLIEEEEAVSAHADPDSVRQILGNLLSNVEKYAASGGYAGITILAGGGSAVILVKDRGPGIAARDRERIFEPFHRLNDRTNEGVSGTGLGLAIARDLAGAMGGGLRLLSLGGPGATFELRLPRTAEDKVIPFPDALAS